MTAFVLHAPSKARQEPPADWPQEDLERVGQCPVCGSPERALLHENLTDRAFFCAPGTWTQYTCAGCGLAYLDPRPTPSSIGRAYAQYFTHTGQGAAQAASLTTVQRLRLSLRNGYRNWRFGTHAEPASVLGVVLACALPGRRELLDAGCRYIPRPAPGGRLLDIGAGNGDFLMTAREAGWEVRGIEPDQAAIAVCAERGLDVLAGGIERLEGQRACFDFITISHVIEHVHEPRQVLQRAFELLKPGGALYIDTPNIDAVGHKRYGVFWRALEPPRHLVLFNWHALERTLHDAGFVRIEHKPRADVYPWLAASSRALAQGRDCYAGKITAGDRLTALLLSMRMRRSHAHSEFVTLLAHKPSDAR